MKEIRTSHESALEIYGGGLRSPLWQVVLFVGNSLRVRFWKDS